MFVTNFGEIMLRLSSPPGTRILQNPVLYPSWAGSEANVAVALSNFGIKTKFLSALPTDALGDECLRTLCHFGVDCSGVIRRKGRMGLFFLELGSMMRPSKIIYDRGRSVFSEIPADAYDWEKILTDSEWLHMSGITPALSKNAAKAALDAAEVANKKGIPVSLDLNYRASLWESPEEAKRVMAPIIGKCDFLFGNEEDFDLMILGKKCGISSSVESHADRFKITSEKICELFPNIEGIFSSLRIAHTNEHNVWSGMGVNSAGELVVAQTWDLESVVDRVGAGDAFAAGIIFGLISKHSPEDTLAFGVAAGALKHTISGDFLVATAGEVSSFSAREKNAARIQR